MPTQFQRALGVRGAPLSISAAVGFIALFGMAVLDGVVLLATPVDVRRDPKLGESWTPLH